MAITAAEAIIRHNTLHQIEPTHVAVEPNQSEVPHASHHLDLSSAIALACIPTIASASSKTSSPASPGRLFLPDFSTWVPWPAGSRNRAIRGPAQRPCAAACPGEKRSLVMAITSVRAKIWHSASRQNQRRTMSSFTYTLDALVAAIVISWIVNYLETSWIANYLETVQAGALRFLTRTSSNQCSHEC